MWKKIIDLKYHSIVKYYIAGTLLAAVVFLFVTQSMQNVGFEFGILLEKENLRLIVAALIGGLVGGLVYVMIIVSIGYSQREKSEYKTEIEGKELSFFIRNTIGFAVGGFAYQLINNMLGLASYENLTQALFSKEYVIRYIGMIIAMIVFSIILSIGLQKRMHLLYGN